jgi:hypothetical protein
MITEPRPRRNATRFALPALGSLGRRSPSRGSRDRPWRGAGSAKLGVAAPGEDDANPPHLAAADHATIIGDVMKPSIVPLFRVSRKRRRIF